MVSSCAVVAVMAHVALLVTSISIGSSATADGGLLEERSELALLSEVFDALQCAAASWDDRDVCPVWASCSRGGKAVTRLKLRQSGCSGRIPESIGSLGSLMAMYLSNNQLSGKIPESIGSLGSLEYMYLNNNQLSGKIPEAASSSCT